MYKYRAKFQSSLRGLEEWNERKSQSYPHSFLTSLCAATKKKKNERGGETGILKIWKPFGFEFLNI